MSKLELKTDDIGLFIALTTIPLGREKIFCDDYMLELFKKEKNYIIERTLKLGFSEKENLGLNNLYNPLFYCLWGSFDLAIISLVDDFALSNRKFHPYSHLFPENENLNFNKNFNYQVNTAAHIYKRGEKSLKKIWLEVSKNKPTKGISPKRKFLGISSLKISNGILLGVGIHMIELIKETLRNVIDGFISKRKYKGKVDYIITNAYTWYELEILFFSDKPDFIPECIEACRKIEVSQIISDARKYKEIVFDNNSSKVSIEAIIENITSHSLLATKNLNALENSHVFSTTYTYLGFDIAILNQTDEQIVEELKLINKLNSKISLVSTIISKPGHFDNIAKMLTDIRRNYEFNLLLGEHDILIEKNGTPKLSISEYILMHRKILHKIEAKDHIRKVRTTPYYKKNIKNSFAPVEVTPAINLENLIFDETSLAEIRDNLYTLHVSKIVRERILKMFINFNEGLRDSILYNNFLDIKGFLENIKVELQKLSGDKRTDNKSLLKFHEYVKNNLVEYADIFEYIYANRFHQSHRMAEITDFNIDFNGGIQQIVSGLDSFYKSIYRVINGSDKKFPVVYVVAQPGVVSNRSALRISYFQVFEPAIFLAEAVKEASNYVLINILDQEDSLLDLINNEKRYFTSFCIKEFKVSDFQEYLILFFENNGSIYDYLLEDIFTYVIGYKCEKELFKFWFWHISLQDASLYTKEGKVNEKLFVRLCLRYHFVMAIFEEDVKNEIFSVNPILQELWNVHFFKIKSFVDQILSKDKLDKSQRLLDRFLICLKRILKCHPDYTFALLKDWIKQNGVGEPFSINNTSISKQQYSFKERLDVVNYFFFHTNNIYEKYFKDSSINYLIERIPEKHKEIYSKKFDIKKLNVQNGLALKKIVFFDPLGGFFVATASMRKDYFRYKISVLNEMIHYSLLYKMEIINEFNIGS